VSDTGGLERTDRELLIGVKRDVRNIAQNMEAENKRRDREYVDHEARIRILENFRWWFLGGIIASGGLASLVTKLLR
jgi:hypothetical protein